MPLHLLAASFKAGRLYGSNRSFSSAPGRTHVHCGVVRSCLNSRSQWPRREATSSLFSSA
jgi:hypothetical protein